MLTYCIDPILNAFSVRLFQTANLDKSMLDNSFLYSVICSCLGLVDQVAEEKLFR